MLNKKIENIKNKYYLQDNKEEFDQLCKQELELPKELIDYCKKNNIEIDDWSSLEEPAGEWHFKYPTYEKDEFKVEYKSELTISKLEKIYSLSHDAFVNNLDPENMGKIEDFADENPICLKQYNVEEILKNNFISYDRMWWIDRVYPVDGLKYNDIDPKKDPDLRPSQDTLAYKNFLEELEPENKYEYDENTFGF